MRPESLQKIAFINFGGIGDEILFAPVIAEVKQYLPQAHTTLFLEDRSSAVKDLLNVDQVIALDVQGQSRLRLFFQLWKTLRGQCFDAVISSGSSPFIPILLCKFNYYVYYYLVGYEYFDFMLIVHNS